MTDQTTDLPITHAVTSCGRYNCTGDALAVNSTAWQLLPDNVTVVATNVLYGHPVSSSSSSSSSGEVSASPTWVMDPNQFDMSHLPYLGSTRHVPVWEAVIKVSICALIMFLAMIGNVLVIAVVCRNKRLRTTTNFYIVNLAVSDIMVTLTCSWVHVLKDLTEGWILGAAFCKINSFSQGNNNIFVN